MSHRPLPRARFSSALHGLALLCVLTACDPESNNDSQGIVPVGVKDGGTTNTKNDMGEQTDMDLSSGDMKSDGDMLTQGGDMTVDGGTITPVDGICSNVEDLGVLDIQTGTYTLTGSTFSPSVLNKFVTECGSGTAPEAGWKFTVNEPVSVRSNILSAGIGWVLELHEGSCSQTTQRFCDSNLTTNFTLPPGDYILIAEPRTNTRGELRLELELTPLVCFPAGTTECNGSDLDLCAAGGATKVQKTCASPCTLDACGGDLCENAIVVDTLPYSFTGKVDGYFDRINFNAANSCVNPATEITGGGTDDPNQPENPDPPEPGESSGLIKTPGQDMVFLVKGLKQGKKLFVDASAAAGDNADSVLFVLDTCDKMTCHLAVDLGDQINGWEIPKDGDYTIIMDRTTDNAADLGITIHVED